jgi:hypothetical protein
MVAGEWDWQPYRHLWADFLENVGSSTSHNPMCLHGLLQGWLYLYFHTFCTVKICSKHNLVNMKRVSVSTYRLQQGQARQMQDGFSFFRIRIRWKKLSGRWIFLWTASSWCFSNEMKWSISLRCTASTLLFHWKWIKSETGPVSRDSNGRVHPCTREGTTCVDWCLGRLCQSWVRSNFL